MRLPVFAALLSLIGTFAGAQTVTPQTITPAWFPHGIAAPAAPLAACANSTDSSADGCATAQAHGVTLQSVYGYPAISTAKIVPWLNVVQGSTYTDGTYSWVTAGGSPSVAATGTVTFSGGKITAWTVSNPGAGYLSRPTIAIPAGAGAGDGKAQMVPTVYQMTPHGMSSPWSQAGVDFPVGVDAVDNVIQTAPTGLPGCAAVTGSVINITTNCDVPKEDMRAFYVHVNCTGCVVTFENDYFKELSTEDAGLKISGSGNTVTVSFSDCTSGATVGGTAPGGDVACIYSSDATVTLNTDHLFCHDTWTKCENFGGGTGTSQQQYTEWANLLVDTCLNTVGTHGEGEYTFTGSAGTARQNPHSKYVVYLNRWHIGQAETTNSANAAALQADAVTINGGGIDHASLLAPGPYAFTGSDNSNVNSGAGPWTGSADDFTGTQEGGSYSGTVSENNNLYDYTGAFGPWNAGPNTASITFSNNKNAVSGNACATGAGNCN